MTTCPTPTKRRFATAAAAAVYARRRALGVGKLLTPYACDGCDWVHLTSAEQVPVGRPADPAVVNELRRSAPDRFRRIVEDDAGGHLDMPRRIALRQPRLHGRWVTALRDPTAALDERLAHAPAGSSWARRAEVFRHHLADRAAEAEALRDRARRAA